MTDQNPLQNKASEWESAQNDSLLLRGKELPAAEDQAAQDPLNNSFTAPILAGQHRNETRRRKRTLTAVIAAGTIVLVLAVIAFARANAAATCAAAALTTGTEKHNKPRQPARPQRNRSRPPRQSAHKQSSKKKT